jgi:glutamyl-tRNA reductase
MVNNFSVLSLSHQNSPLETREIFAFNEDQQKAISLKIKDIFGISELLILSTCNRTEVYYVSEKNIANELIKTLAAEKGTLDKKQSLKYFDLKNGINAIEHLFKVASGLDSKIIGDLQIPYQLKKSYQNAVDLDMAAVFLHRLMHTIFYANKRIATETSFRDGTTSIVYQAVSLANHLVSHIVKPKILVLGLGEVGINICNYLADNNFGEVTIMTRTLSKAQSIAKIHQISFAPIEDLNQEINKANIIISSLRAEKTTINKNTISEKSGFNHKYFLDLSVPRSIDENLEDIPGVLLYNIETIQTKIDEASKIRMMAVSEVENIIKESIECILEWSQESMISPTIIKLKNALNNIRKEEIGRYLKTLNEREAEMLENITQNIIQKIIKLPAIGLKSSCKRGDSENMINILTELFDLDTQKIKN